jgi:hypothetical protein
MLSHGSPPAGRPHHLGKSILSVIKEMIKRSAAPYVRIPDGEEMKKGASEFTELP